MVMDTLDAATMTDAESMQRAEEARLSQVAGLTLSLIAKRKEAMDWRQGCGIEKEWSDADDAYEGVDDANRGEAALQKPRSPNGGSYGATRKLTTRSTAYLNITRPYTDAAAARVADMLIPSDERNFSIRPTPIPDVAGIQIPPEQAAEVKAQLEAEAQKRSEAAQLRIEDWLTECHYDAEMRKVIEDCAKLGTGILKGPYPVRRKQDVVMQQADGGGLALVQAESIVPASRRVSVWDFFPDKSCGESINNGAYVFERDRISARQVRDLIGQPGYLDRELMACLREGPSRGEGDPRRKGEDESFEVWYFTGEITRSDLDALYQRAGDDVHALMVTATIINDRIVKIAESPLECRDYGYDLMCWQRRIGMPYGIGVASQISVPQRMLNAATRNMNDNAALSSGPQIVCMRGAVMPADGAWELVPRKLWWADPESSVDDIRKAFMAIDIPTRQAELMAQIQFALKIAEDVTGLPMLMQGNQGKAPDTVGGMEILNTNANTVLRRIARLFDDLLTKPHIRRYYAWIMEYGDESEKGDFQIDARGSTSLVERDIQRQAILGMGAMVVDPRFGLDPELWAQEMLRANKIDPKRLALTDAKKQQMQAQQVAQLQAQQQAAQQALEARMRADQMRLETQKAINQSDNLTDLTIARERNATSVALGHSVAAIR